ncbi:MAG: cation:proton antiporter [Candidatus Eiseniibacteriota bacterium]|jgi:Kef-type K+ transport system membrane component KefB/Trk K+ transport system NAD-binding subunit
MEHSGPTFIPLLIVVALAFVVPLVLARLRLTVIPAVVGEIVAGMIVGPSVFDLVSEGPVLRILSELGFVYLMFLSGLEIHLPDPRGLARDAAGVRRTSLAGHPFVIGHVLFGLGLAGSLAAALPLEAAGWIRDPWLMALILSTTSLGVVVPVLKQRGLTGTPLGRLIVMAAMVADFASILLISVYVLLRTGGPSAELLLVLVLLVAFLATWRLVATVRQAMPAGRILEELSSVTSQLKLRGSFALALIFVGLSEALGVESILGAFLAGMIISFLSGREGSGLRGQLDAIGYGFFVPIFFIMVGVGFDLPALVGADGALYLVPVLLAVAYAVKLVPALLLRRLVPWRETLAAGALLGSRLSLIIAASAIGLEMDAITAPVNAAIVLVAVVTCTVSPIVFGRLVPAATPRERILVLGKRSTAALLVRRLRAHGKEAVSICTDAEFGGSPDGDPSATRDQELADAMRRAGAESAALVVAIDESDALNLRIASVARHVLGVERILARVTDPGQNEAFRELGARVVNPAYSTLLMLEALALEPAAFSIAADPDEHQSVREVKLLNRRLAGRPARDVELGDAVMVLMIRRGDAIVVADRGTELRVNDRLTLVGSDRELVQAARMLSRTE